MADTGAKGNSFKAVARRLSSYRSPTTAYIDEMLQYVVDNAPEGSSAHGVNVNILRPSIRRLANACYTDVLGEDLPAKDVPKAFAVRHKAAVDKYYAITL